MALNIKDQETERLAAEVAELSKDSKTGAVRQALRERRDRLRLQSEGRNRRDPGSMRRFLEAEIWPLIPPKDRGRPALSKEEIEEILGYGPGGV